MIVDKAVELGDSDGDALRIGLDRLARQAPTSIPGLEEQLFAARRRRRATGIAAIAAVLVAGSATVLLMTAAGGTRQGQVNSASARPLTSHASDPFVTCPARFEEPSSIASHTASSKVLVPGTPTRILICDYGAVAAGPAANTAVLVGLEMSSVVTHMNSLPTGSCPSAGSGDSILLRVGYATGPDTDVLLKAGKCSQATNGIKQVFSTTSIALPLINDGGMDPLTLGVLTTESGVQTTITR